MNPNTDIRWTCLRIKAIQGYNDPQSDRQPGDGALQVS
jgi:hypothetical protein